MATGNLNTNELKSCTNASVEMCFEFEAAKPPKKVTPTGVEPVLLP